MMIVEIVSTGSELLLGQITNTSAPYMARRLNELGFSILYQTTVGDNRVRMARVIEHALTRADLVITSGGLGPTLGDITKEVAANLLQRKMQLHSPSEKNIRQIFAARKMTMTDNNLRQAMIPEGAVVLANQCGTAPGVIMKTDDGAKAIIQLPGPPHELEAMFEESVVPYLLKEYGVQGIIVSRVLRVYGIGESALEEEIRDYLLAQKNPTIALLVRSGEIFVRITAQAENEAAARDLITDLEERLRQRLASYIFATDEDGTLEQIVGKLLLKGKFTIAAAESCTGGLLTSHLTDVPGSSAYLLGSVVSYDNKIKIEKVGVDPNKLAACGAVSPEVAKEMAAGVKNAFSTDLGIGITGIAGPDGGSELKPVGLVFIAIDGPEGLQCYEHRFTGERTLIKNRTVQAALHHLRQYIS